MCGKIADNFYFHCPGKIVLKRSRWCEFFFNLFSSTRSFKSLHFSPLKPLSLNPLKVMWQRTCFPLPWPFSQKETFDSHNIFKEGMRMENETMLRVVRVKSFLRLSIHSSWNFPSRRRNDSHAPPEFWHIKFMRSEVDLNGIYEVIKVMDCLLRRKPKPLSRRLDYLAAVSIKPI